VLLAQALIGALALGLHLAHDLVDLAERLAHRLHQLADRLAALLEIALRRLLELGERLLGELQEGGVVGGERIGRQRPEAVGERLLGVLDQLQLFGGVGALGRELAGETPGGGLRRFELHAREVELLESVLGQRHRRGTFGPADQQPDQGADQQPGEADRELHLTSSTAGSIKTRPSRSGLLQAHRAKRRQRGFARQRHRISVGHAGVAIPKERMPGFSTVMARITPGPALAVLAVAFALGLSRLQFGIGHTTFDYMSQARWLLDGGDLGGLTTTQPPGYTLIWLLLLVLPRPLLGGFILSLLSQAITVWCVYELIAKPATRTAGLVGAALVAVNGALTGSADYVWVEGPFTAALTGAWLAFERLIFRAREQRYAGPVLGTALLAVLPLYLRYAAAPVLAVMLAFALFTA